MAFWLQNAALGQASWDSLDCINLTEVGVSALLGAIIPPAFKLSKCAGNIKENAKNLQNNKSRADELRKKIDDIFGKPNLGKQRRKFGRELGKTNKAIGINQAQIKKYVAIGVGVYVGSQIAKAIAGGEKRSLFMGADCSE